MSSPEFASRAADRDADRLAAALAASAPTAETLPLRADLAALFPWGGLRRGGTVVVHRSTALLLALLAEATGAGSWGAVVGLPRLGVVAAAELGVQVERLALVPAPGAELGAVVAALLDGFDVVAVAAPRVADALARRLSARARGRKAVLLSLGAWPGAEVELRSEGDRWWGLGSGHGHLRGRTTLVRAGGRGAATRPVQRFITLQGESIPPALTHSIIEHMFDTSATAEPGGDR
ncbi:hypothetical protein [Actinokineospora sp. PR83]|uniref:hypothetical protein n=1 Tax=Actinokineospora sp. PR83 TaxID=2884908 RepID=UPI0035AB895A